MDYAKDREGWIKAMMKKRGISRQHAESLADLTNTIFDALAKSEQEKVTPEEQLEILFTFVAEMTDVSYETKRLAHGLLDGTISAQIVGHTNLKTGEVTWNKDKIVH